MRACRKPTARARRPCPARDSAHHHARSCAGHRHPRRRARAQPGRARPRHSASGRWLLARLGELARGRPGVRSGVRRRVRPGDGLRRGGPEDGRDALRPHRGEARWLRTASAMRRPADLAAAWGARPWGYSRPVWALVLALDALPWPWGEEILARGFAARAFVRLTRF